VDVWRTFRETGDPSAQTPQVFDVVAPESVPIYTSRLVLLM
jgi:hypothetical protein